MAELTYDFEREALRMTPRILAWPAGNREFPYLDMRKTMREIGLKKKIKNILSLGCVLDI